MVFLAFSSNKRWWRLQRVFLFGRHSFHFASPSRRRIGCDSNQFFFFKLHIAQSEKNFFKRKLILVFFLFWFYTPFFDLLEIMTHEGETYNFFGVLYHSLVLLIYFLLSYMLIFIFRNTLFSKNSFWYFIKRFLHARQFSYSEGASILHPKNE